MQTYKIIMTPDATDDITELSRYIAKNLLAPETALSYVRAIRQEIAKLSEMPGIYNRKVCPPPLRRRVPYSGCHISVQWE